MFIRPISVRPELVEGSVWFDMLTTNGVSEYENNFGQVLIHTLHTILGSFRKINYPQTCPVRAELVEALAALRQAQGERYSILGRLFLRKSLISCHVSFIMQ